MQLEIGKYYATRLGTIAKIVGNGDMASIMLGIAAILFSASAYVA